MPTYRIITLGCKVNHYESLQIEQLLRESGYQPADDGEADVVVVNTCSVTASAAAKSRNLLRRFARRPRKPGAPPHTIAVGCWATSDPAKAREIVGPLAAIGHDRSAADELHRLLATGQYAPAATPDSQPQRRALPILEQRQPANQRAVLKVQDGCDAHCTYCIIPKLRPILWSRPVDDVVREASNMVAAGHHEIVLTGVFLGAFGQQTALHRRQTRPSSGLADLVEQLCTRVPGLLRLRLSSLEPGDVTPELIERLRSHRQVMPHFHLPLQSGADRILRKMNRQYGSAGFRKMVDDLRKAFDRPALTTDVIVGFPGESEDDFAQTLELARFAGFLHIHSFPFSPREQTAAARWKEQMVTQRIVTQRMLALQQLSTELSQEFRRQFIGEEVELLVEHPSASDMPGRLESDSALVRHGRCERYFAVHFESEQDLTGQRARVRVDRVTAARTLGTLLHV